jgi:hypothetical protein
MWEPLGAVLVDGGGATGAGALDVDFEGAGLEVGDLVGAADEGALLDDDGAADEGEDGGVEDEGAPGVVESTATNVGRLTKNTAPAGSCQAR